MTGRRLWVSSITGPKTSTKCSNLYVMTPGGQPKGEGNCGCLAQYNQDCSRQVGFVSHGRLLTYERGTPIVNPPAGEARKPRSATHLGEGNSDVKPTAQGPLCHRPDLLGHGR